MEKWPPTWDTVMVPWCTQPARAFTQGLETQMLEPCLRCSSRCPSYLHAWLEIDILDNQCHNDIPSSFDRSLNPPSSQTHMSTVHVKPSHPMQQQQHHLRQQLTVVPEADTLSLNPTTAVVTSFSGASYMHRRVLCMSLCVCATRRVLMIPLTKTSIMHPTHLQIYDRGELAVEFEK